jgi:hypothetical protein
MLWDQAEYQSRVVLGLPQQPHDWEQQLQLSCLHAAAAVGGGEKGCSGSKKQQR